jgi:hypothetical protein
MAQREYLRLCIEGRYRALLDADGVPQPAPQQPNPHKEAAL